MAKFHFERCVLAIALILLILPGTNLLSQAAHTRQVLILNSYDSNAEPYDKVTEVFKAELQKQFGEPIAFNETNLEIRRGELGAREDLVAQLLQDTYADTPLDIVFAVGFPGIRFWTKYRDSISGQAPMIALIREGVFAPEDLRPGDIARFTQLSFSGLVDDLLRLRPDTSHVVMVFGSAPTERTIVAGARRELAAYTERLKFEYTNNMTVDELQVRLGELSEESAVFFGLFGIDADGVILPGDLGLALTRLASTAPLFGAFDYQLGNGIVGGRLMQLQQIGVDAAVAGAAVLRGETVRDPWKVFEFGTPVYDWRELDRWGIDTKRLPAGSEIRHRPPPVWDQYADWIVMACAVLAFQGLLIFSLLTQRRHRASAEQGQMKLSGQLISAYEDERTAIARELHDDLSQRLARLAIDAGTIRGDQNSDALDDELENLREELARVSEDVHDMSYRLHPSLVEDLGISTALRTECQRVRRYSDVSIKEYIEEIDKQIPNDVALCVFRLVQEALNNAARHARAESIEIVLETDGRTLRLDVSDDGRGFDEAEVTSGSGRGIGLLSMRERIRLVDGTLSIQSTPGAGTTVSAEVPLTGENP